MNFFKTRREYTAYFLNWSIRCLEKDINDHCNTPAIWKTIRIPPVTFQVIYPLNFCQNVQGWIFLKFCPFWIFFTTIMYQIPWYMNSKWKNTVLCLWLPFPHWKNIISYTEAFNPQRFFKNSELNWKSWKNYRFCQKKKSPPEKCLYNKDLLCKVAKSY